MATQTQTSWWERFDDDGLQAEQPWYKRRGFLLTLFVLAVGMILYLPGLGSYTLWSPWEPHYSQVAMEMNQVDSWLVPTYRHSDRWFSKPILLFWFLKPSFQILGQTEFAARLPIVLFALFGLAMVNFMVGRLFNWKVGLLSSMILATSPQWFFISRQTIFDGPYVVVQTIAFLYLLVGLFKYPDRARWMYGFWIFSGLAMLLKGLLAIVLPASAVGLFILVTWDWSILKRMKFGKGFLIFLTVAAPWFIFMTTKFGYQYFHSFFVYHHFERAAGLIKKPNASFDLYIQQIVYATFPWSAFLPVALARFLTWRSSDVHGETRKNLMVFLCAAMPYIFFSYSSTKFHHYIFPVVPFLGIMVAYYLERMMREGAKPIVRFELLLAALIFGVIAKDIVTDYKHLIHLFIYYYERDLPRLHVQPLFYAAFIPMAVLMVLPTIRRKLTWPVMTGLVVMAATFAMICNFWLMPKVTPHFSQKILLEAYNKLSDGSDPICEYHSWERRNVSYYFDNKSVYLNARRAGSAERFFKKEGRLFCMVDHNYYNKLRSEVKQATGKDLLIVNSDHPFTYLVSTQPLEQQVRNKDKFILNEAPVVKNRSEAVFDGKIRLLGWELDDKKFKIGDEITVTLYFEVLDRIDKDYSIFIHGEVYGAQGRMVGDHLPVQGTYQTDQWKKGQYIVDTWTGRIPDTISEGRLSLYVGFFNGKTRMKIMDGQGDGLHRYKLTTVQVTTK
jgi:hypothetical protein